MESTQTPRPLETVVKEIKAVQLSPLPDFQPENAPSIYEAFSARDKVVAGMLDISKRPESSLHSKSYSGEARNQGLTAVATRALIENLAIAGADPDTIGIDFQEDDLQQITHETPTLLGTFVLGDEIAGMIQDAGLKREVTPPADNQGVIDRFQHLASRIDVLLKALSIADSDKPQAARDMVSFLTLVSHSNGVEDQVDSIHQKPFSVLAAEVIVKHQLGGEVAEMVREKGLPKATAASPVTPTDVAPPSDADPTQPAPPTTGMDDSPLKWLQDLELEYELGKRTPAQGTDALPDWLKDADTTLKPPASPAAPKPPAAPPAVPSRAATPAAPPLPADRTNVKQLERPGTQPEIGAHGVVLTPLIREGVTIIKDGITIRRPGVDSLRVVSPKSAAQYKNDMPNLFAEDPLTITADEKLMAYRGKLRRFLRLTGIAYMSENPEIWKQIEAGLALVKYPTTREEFRGAMKHFRWLVEERAGDTMLPEEKRLFPQSDNDYHIIHRVLSFLPENAYFDLSSDEGLSAQMIAGIPDGYTNDPRQTDTLLEFLLLRQLYSQPDARKALNLDNLLKRIST